MTDSIFTKIKNKEIPGNIVYEDDKPGEALVTLCEDTLANEILGWTPTKNIRDYINKTL